MPGGWRFGGFVRLLPNTNTAASLLTPSSSPSSKAPSVNDVLRSWQYEVSLPSVPHKLYAMRPGLPALRMRPHSSGSGVGGGSGGSETANPSHPTAASDLHATATPLPCHVDLAIVNSVFSWRPARLSMGLVFLLDRGCCTALRAYFTECVLPAHFPVYAMPVHEPC